MPNASSLSPLARDIFAYLRVHPSSRDSLEGIVEWWMLQQDLLRAATEVRLALEELVTGGLVEELQRAGRVHYRLTLRH